VPDNDRPEIDLDGEERDKREGGLEINRYRYDDNVISTTR